MKSRIIGTILCTALVAGIVGKEKLKKIKDVKSGDVILDNDNQDELLDETLGEDDFVDVLQQQDDLVEEATASDMRAKESSDLDIVLENTLENNIIENDIDVDSDTEERAIKYDIWKDDNFINTLDDSYLMNEKITIQDYCGAWKATKVESNGVVMSAMDVLEKQFTICLYDDSTAFLDAGGRISEVSWKSVEDGIIITNSKNEEKRFINRNSKLVISEDGILLFFEKI
ncbi:MAG: hypothetical protein PUI85_00960 [Eubacteriales bacterium]|nr:hypothetical protein [Eubacteriales bacterium]MDY3332715.1 hypothetical protein [Gallibacter sp.]